MKTGWAPNLVLVQLKSMCKMKSPSPGLPLEIGKWQTGPLLVRKAAFRSGNWIQFLVSIHLSPSAACWQAVYLLSQSGIWGDKFAVVFEKLCSSMWHLKICYGFNIFVSQLDPSSWYLKTKKINLFLKEQDLCWLQFDACHVVRLKAVHMFLQFPSVNENVVQVMDDQL